MTFAKVMDKAENFKCGHEPQGLTPHKGGNAGEMTEQLNI